MPEFVLGTNTFQYGEHSTSGLGRAIMARFARSIYSSTNLRIQAEKIINGTLKGE